jgi:hypothetical protein
MDQNLKIVQVEAGRDELVASASKLSGRARSVRHSGVGMAEAVDRTAAGRAGGTQER